MSLVWSPDLLLGNTQIDEQHKRIFQILAKLISAIADDKGHDEVGGVLATASVFVAAHFKMEEDLMAQFDYPDLAAHRKAHEAVRVQVERLVDQYHGGGLDPLELVNFMELWLQEHVQREDRPLAEFLNALDQAAG
jgi:hemerythrin-like metal-binding protein